MASKKKPVITPRFLDYPFQMVKDGPEHMEDCSRMAEIIRQNRNRYGKPMVERAFASLMEIKGTISGHTECSAPSLQILKGRKTGRKSPLVVCEHDFSPTDGLPEEEDV